MVSHHLHLASRRTNLAPSLILQDHFQMATSLTFVRAKDQVTQTLFDAASSAFISPSTNLFSIFHDIW
jgi:hypothetical protein